MIDLTDDRTGEPISTNELRAAQPDDRVVDLCVDVGKRLVVEVPDVDVRRLDLLSRLPATALWYLSPERRARPDPNALCVRLTVLY